MNQAAPTPGRPGDVRFNLAIAVVLTAIMPALGLGATLGRPYSLYAFAAVVGVMLVSISLYSGRAIGLLLVLILFLPIPAGSPVAGYVAGLSFYVSDALLLLVVLFFPTRLPAGQRGVSVAFIFLMCMGAVVGLLNGAPLDRVLLDLRPALYMFAAFTIGFGRPSLIESTGALRLTAFVLWYSIGAILVAVFTGLSITGGSVNEISSPLQGSSFGDVQRFQIQSTQFALFVLCAGLAMVVAVAQTGRNALKNMARIVLPALVVVFFGFSRHSIVALGVTLLVAFAVTTQKKRLLKILPISLVVLGILAIPLIVSISADENTAKFFASQVHGYQRRVIQGLSSEVIAKDQGVELRDYENRYALEAFMQSPLTGLGLGANYRPRLPSYLEDFFPEDVGPGFSHNVYLWYLAKVGLPGLLALAVFVLTPVFRSLRDMRVQGTSKAQFNGAIAAAVIGFLTVNLVAPYLNSLQGATLIGLVLGVLSYRDNSSTDRKHVVRHTSLSKA